MGVRLVVLDCDLTLWDHHNATELGAPFTLLDPETVADAGGTRIRLRPGARALLQALRDRGILISIASWNEPGPVFAILEALGLRDHFTAPRVEPHPYKERMIADLIAELASTGLPLAPEEILFVDDRELHLRRVRDALGPIQTLLAGVGLADLREVLARID